MMYPNVKKVLELAATSFELYVIMAEQLSNEEYQQLSEVKYYVKNTEQSKIVRELASMGFKECSTIAARAYIVIALGEELEEERVGLYLKFIKLLEKKYERVYSWKTK